MCTCISVFGEDREHPKECFIAYRYNTELELLPVIMVMVVVNLVMRKLYKIVRWPEQCLGLFTSLFPTGFHYWFISVRQMVPSRMYKYSIHNYAQNNQNLVHILEFEN